MMYARYDDPERLLDAVRALRDKAKLEAYTPYPVEGLPELLRIPRSRIGVLAFVVGLSTAIATYFLEWWITAYSYPLEVGARPQHFPLSYVPICFEMGVLSAALTCITAVAVAGRFGQLWDPVFELPGFESASRDRHWLRVEGDVREALEQTQPEQIVEAPP